MHSSATPASGAAGESGAAARVAAGRQVMARRPTQTSAQAVSRSAQVARQAAIIGWPSALQCNARIRCGGAPCSGQAGHVSTAIADIRSGSVTVSAGSPSGSDQWMAECTPVRRPRQVQQVNQVRRRALQRAGRSWLDGHRRHPFRKRHGQRR